MSAREAAVLADLLRRERRPLPRRVESSRAVRRRLGWAMVGLGLRLAVIPERPALATSSCSAVGQ